MIYGSVVLCLSLCTLRSDGFRFGSSSMRHVSSLRSSPSTTDNRGPSAKHDPSAYTLAILGDLHLDPRYMDDHVIGQKHFLSIIKDKAGNPKPNTCVISLGDLGESKSVYPDKTKELFAGTTGCLKLAREFLDGFGVPFEVVGGNHDLEGIDEFPTDETNLQAYLEILGKPTPQFSRLIAEKTMLIGLGSTVFREARYTSHEVFIDDAQVQFQCVR
jgi:Calcineurin-like phosphoesterase